MDVSKFLLYHSLGEDDGYFTDYGGMTAREWFHVNREKFLFPLEAIRDASRPYGDAPWGCGVYFLFLDADLVYVGLSVRIGKRIGEHMMPNIGNRSTWFNRYTAIWVPDRLLENVESYYIHKFSPPRNSQVWALAPFMRQYIE